MPLRPQSGNMYPFVTHTWNPIKGRCSHDCVYCYMKDEPMKRFSQKPIRLDEKELKTDLGEGNFIFVGSGTDMWAEDVPKKWIHQALEHCRKYQNRYLLQSKDPARLPRIGDLDDWVAGTTIETNREYSISSAPHVDWRSAALKIIGNDGVPTMVTIEPILDFDLPELVQLVKLALPAWVNIGADSKGHGLPEPSAEKARELINELGKFTEVKVKSNLKRIMGGRFGQRAGYYA